MIERSARPDNVTLAAFAAIILLGGANSVAIRFSNVELPPFWGAAARFAAATLVMYAVMLYLRLPFPRGPALAGIAVFGILNFGLSYAFIYWGLLDVQAGLAQVVIAIAPLMTYFLALAHRQERWQIRPVLGSLLALAGIAVVFGEQVSAAVPPLALLAIVAAAACASEATVLAKAIPPVHIVTLNAVAMAIGTAFLAALAFVAGERLSVPNQLDTWLAFWYLVLIGTVAVFVLFLFVLRRWTASGTSYVFVLTPFVTVAVGVWLAGETVTWTFLIGGALVLVGVYIGALAPTGTPTLKGGLGGPEVDPARSLKDSAQT
ncbi:MAG TPA: EamA family transporter [Candidatus Limnocylindria bacterium]|nr:EamA family transporter [Candidatus Limnocylindria bacterium]